MAAGTPPRRPTEPHLALIPVVTSHEAAAQPTTPPPAVASNDSAGAGIGTASDLLASLNAARRICVTGHLPPPYICPWTPAPENHNCGHVCPWLGLRVMGLAFRVAVRVRGYG